MFRRPVQTFIICITIVIALIVFHQLGWFRATQGIILKSLSSIEGFFYKIGERTHSFFVLLSSIRDLVEQNSKLQERVNQLLVEKARLKELERENELLRQQLDFVKSEDKKLLSAFVLAFDPSGLFQYITIDRGKEDGVSKEMPVVISGGILVGKIKEVDSFTSKVLLITDPSSSIPALIQSSQAPGIIKGEMKLGLIMEMIPQDIEVKVQDTVITSNLGDKFPQGLVVGQVEEIERSESELFQKARIRPFCDFKKLEMVSVILE